MFWSFAANFLFCEFDENVTSSFNELNGVICQSEWYSFPNDIQRMPPIIMMTSRKTNILQSFGGVALTREVFKTVRLLLKKH